MVENRFRRVQVERKNQHFAECYLENNSPRCFCEAQKSKAGLVPRAPLVNVMLKLQLKTNRCFKIKYATNVKHRNVN